MTCERSFELAQPAGRTQGRKVQRQAKVWAPMLRISSLELIFKFPNAETETFFTF